MKIYYSNPDPPPTTQPCHACGFVMVRPTRQNCPRCRAKVARTSYVNRAFVPMIPDITEPMTFKAPEGWRVVSIQHAGVGVHVVMVDSISYVTGKPDIKRKPGQVRDLARFG